MSPIPIASTLTNYPNLSAWNLEQSHSELGFFYWFGTLAALTLFLVLSWGQLSDNRRKIARLVMVVGYLGSLAIVAAPLLAGLLPLSLAALVAGSWGFSMRGAGFRLPALPGIAWVLLAALVLRLPGMFESFWYDESFTAAYTRLSLDRLGAAVLADVHPPLWYAIAWVNARLFGFSEFAYRLPALAAGVVAVWLAYRLARRLVDDPRYALLVAGFMAVLPSLIYYSNEARGYSLLLCGALALTLALVERRPWLWLLAAVVCLLTHNIGYVYVAVSGLVCLVLMRSAHLRHGWRWLAALTGAALVGLSWLPFMFLQSGDIADGFWLSSLTAGGLFMPIVSVTLGGRVTDSLLLHTTGAVILVSLLSVWAARRWLLSWPGVLVASWFLVPLLVALVSVLWRPVYLDRALMPAFMALPFCWAYALLYLYKADRNTAAALLAPALALALLVYYQPDRQRVDFNRLAAACAGADVVYTSDLPAAFMASYYATPDVVVWPAANDLNQTLPLAVKADLFTLGYLENQRGSICLIDVVNPLNKQSEQDYLAAHVPESARPRTVVTKTNYQVVVYRWLA